MLRSPCGFANSLCVSVGRLEGKSAIGDVEKLEERFFWGGKGLGGGSFLPAAARTAQGRMWLRRHILTPLQPSPPSLLTTRGLGGGGSVSGGEKGLKSGTVGRALRMSGVASGRARGGQPSDCAHAPHTCEWLVVCGAEMDGWRERRSDESGACFEFCLGLAKGLTRLRRSSAAALRGRR